MRIVTDECPCLHAVRVETSRRLAMLPDPGCSACHGTGEARFMRPTNPRNVRIGKVAAP